MEKRAKRKEVAPWTSPSLDKSSRTLGAASRQRKREMVASKASDTSFARQKDGERHRKTVALNLTSQITHLGSGLITWASGSAAGSQGPFGTYEYSSRSQRGGTAEMLRGVVKDNANTRKRIHILKKSRAHKHISEIEKVGLRLTLFTLSFFPSALLIPGTPEPRHLPRQPHRYASHLCNLDDQYSGLRRRLGVPSCKLVHRERVEPRGTDLRSGDGPVGVCILLMSTSPMFNSTAHLCFPSSTSPGATSPTSSMTTSCSRPTRRSSSISNGNSTRSFHPRCR